MLAIGIFFFKKATSDHLFHEIITQACVNPLLATHSVIGSLKLFYFMRITFHCYTRLIITVLIRWGAIKPTQILYGEKIKTNMLAQVAYVKKANNDMVVHNTCCSECNVNKIDYSAFCDSGSKIPNRMEVLVILFYTFLLLSFKYHISLNESRPWIVSAGFSLLRFIKSALILFPHSCTCD